MRGGYTGKYLDINLTTGQIEKKEVDEKMIQEYVGGGGFSARILWDETSQSTDPLGPESPLIIMTGPLTGTLAPTGNCWYGAGCIWEPPGRTGGPGARKNRLPAKSHSRC